MADNTVYQRSMNMMNKEMAEAFDLSKEPDALREAYGKGVFGQGCLMARRLVERGVPVVEVALSGWDTHVKGFDALKPLSAELDAGWATLVMDLERQGLLERTTILWLGEFGRTPQINANAGARSFPVRLDLRFCGRRHRHGPGLRTYERQRAPRRGESGRRRRRAGNRLQSRRRQPANGEWRKAHQTG